MYFGKHNQAGAHGNQYRAERGGLEQGEKNIRVPDITKTQKLSGDSGADIGAHDHGQCLGKLEDTGIQKADYHNRGGGRALNHRCYAGAQQDSFPGIIRQLLQGFF